MRLPRQPIKSLLAMTYFCRKGHTPEGIFCFGNFFIFGFAIFILCVILYLGGDCSSILNYTLFHLQFIHFSYGGNIKWHKKYSLWKPFCVTQTNP